MSTESNGNGNVVDWFAAQATAQFPSQWVSILCLQRLDQQDVLSWQWVAVSQLAVAACDRSTYQLGSYSAPTSIA